MLALGQRKRNLYKKPMWPRTETSLKNNIDDEFALLRSVGDQFLPFKYEVEEAKTNLLLKTCQTKTTQKQDSHTKQQTTKTNPPHQATLQTANFSDIFRLLCHTKKTKKHQKTTSKKQAHHISPFSKPPAICPLQTASFSDIFRLLCYTKPEKIFLQQQKEQAHHII